MSDSQEMTTSPNPPPGETPSELRGKLLRRLAVAGGLVATLLGVLALFDHLASTPDDSEAPVFTQPVPVAPRKEVTQPVTPTDQLPEPPAQTPPAVAPTGEAPAAPEASAPGTAQDTTPPAAASDKPTMPENRRKLPSTAANDAAQAAAAVPAAKPSKSPASTPAAAPAPATPEATTAPSNVLPPKTSSEPKLRPPPREERIASTPPAVATPNTRRLFPGFLLQAGVFTSPQRAEELHARLVLSGVPSSMETRVQIGPFKTRQEAEAAQEKLRELGVNTVLVPPSNTTR